MSKKLAIKGHETRGKEIIELLEMMGGINKNMLSAHIGDVLNPHVYFLELDSSDNRIVWNYLLGLEWDGRASDMMIFTLEEFLEKYPFKVGDKVYIKVDPNENCLGYDKIYGEIESAMWVEKFGYVVYKLKDYSGIFYREDLHPYKEEESMEDNKLFGTLCNPVETKSYTVGLKDGKVIECEVNKIKPLFKAGDVVKLKGDPDENLFWIVVDVVEDGYIFNDGEKRPFDDQHHYEKSNREIINAIDITAKVVDKNHKMGPKSKLPSKYYEDKLEETQSKRDIDKSEFIIKHMILPNKVDDKLEYEIIDGYEFDKVDNNKIILKPIKPKYPTTYEECKEMLSENVYYGYSIFMTLQKLIICRDVYWKIYGEQMGLGEPWKPNWNEETNKFTISNKCNKIYLNNTAWYAEVLSFPTAEMRDAFYENFKKEIEQCKYLL